MVLICAASLGPMFTKKSLKFSTMFLGPVMFCPWKVKDLGKSFRTVFGFVEDVSDCLPRFFYIIFMLVEVLFVKIGFGFTY